MTLDLFVALDVETTGFGPSAHVIEVGVVTFEKGEVVRSWSSLLHPAGVDWDSSKVQEALAINHIKREDLKGQPTFEEIFADLLLELSCPVWVAHNVDFDLGMLRQERARMNGLDAPALLTPRLALCTMLLSREIHSREKGHKLGETAARWGVVQDGEHRAASDAITCGRILHAMRTRKALPENFGELEVFYKQATVKRRR